MRAPLSLLCALVPACGEVRALDDAAPADGAVTLDAPVDAAPDAPVDAPPDAAFVCMPGAARCTGNAPERCGPDGQWQAQAACLAQTCVDGACQGVCAPGQRTCNVMGASVCDAAGAWSTTPHSQPRWSRTFGTALDEQLYVRGGFAVTPTGELLFAGGQGPSTALDFHVLQGRTDGTVAWARTFGTLNEAAQAVLPLAGGAVACGTVNRNSMSCTANRICAACVRLGADGSTVWQRAWAGSNNDFGGVNALVASGTGFQMAAFTTQSDIWMDLASVVVDASGNASAFRTINRDGEDQMFDLRRAPDGSLVAAGYTNGWRACQQPWLARYNEAGVLVASFPMGPCTVEAPGQYNEQRGFAYSLVPLADGSVVAVGRQWAGAARFQGFIAKVSLGAAPAEQWRRLFGGNGDEVFSAIEPLPDGGFLLAGATTTMTAGGSDMLVVRTDAAGQVLWTRTYGGVAEDVALSIARLPDGSYAIAGNTASSGAGARDYQVIDLAAVCP